MKASFNQHRLLLSGLIALAITGIAAPALAQTASSAPLMATDEPAASGTGANPGDLAREELQATPQAFPVAIQVSASELQQAAAPETGGAAVKAADEPTPSGTGANPGDSARAEMQAHLQPFPWQG